MISEIQIENFKSIASLTLKPGMLTVLIGENGSGKSNVLEAIAFAAAASADKLDDEFLYTRGIRVTDKEWMRSAFVEPQATLKSGAKIPRSISLKVSSSDIGRPLKMTVSEPSTPIRGKVTDHWQVRFSVDPDEIELETAANDFSEQVEILKRNLPSSIPEETVDRIAREIVARGRAERKKRRLAPEVATTLNLKDFLIYSPENSELRTFEREGAIKPLGSKGEGLLKLLSDAAATGDSKFASELKSLLGLLGWFGDLRLPTEEDEIRGRLRIRDLWLSGEARLFDQRSANEGFLFLLFYFALFLSKSTPPFFAIDNIDNSLNPKLCSELIRQLCALAKKTGKQVICTTHNPAILDGLNLNDDDQRLYVVRRNSDGHTVVNRVKAPRPRPGGDHVKLSTAFMSGLLGGLPDHF
jgi:predicted ATPase